MEQKDIQKAYEKLKKSVQTTLEKDSFYEKFSAYLESGKSLYDGQNIRVVRKVDPVWVNAIYRIIPNLEQIVNHPRKTMKQDEAVVPVELARRTTADSVRHLASNTHLINRIEHGQVVPSKILNVFNEESYEMYENRFILTLINRLNLFLNKRIEMIGDKLGDDFKSIVRFQSSFEHDHIKTEYGLDMSINLGAECFTEHDEQMRIYGHIETIRQHVNGFTHSEFMQELKGCSVVRSPIMRTNLLAKEPNYRACYELWMFLDEYDEVGYTINTENKKIEFDEEFMGDLNLSLAFTYLLMRENLDGERKLRGGKRPYRLKTVKPKFVKKYKREFVHSEDIDDLTILKVARDEGHSEQVEKIIVSAIERALYMATVKKAKRIENEERLKREAEELEQRKRDKERQREQDLRIKRAIENAIRLEQTRKRKRKLQVLEQSDAVLAAIERALEIAAENGRIRKIVRELLKNQDELEENGDLERSAEALLEKYMAFSKLNEEKED